MHERTLWREATICCHIANYEIIKFGHISIKIVGKFEINKGTFCIWNVLIGFRVTERVDTIAPLTRSWNILIICLLFAVILISFTQFQTEN